MNTALAIVFYAVLPVLFLLAVILWVIYVHDDFDGHGRAAWRWLTGRTLKDEVPEIEPFNPFQVPMYHPDWRQYGVTRDVLNDDLYGRVNAQRAVIDEHYARERARLMEQFRACYSTPEVIDTLHDSTMMARIDKGEQAEADFPWWLDYSGSVAKPWICPDVPEPDPYEWHDVATLIDMANEVGA